MLEKEGFQFLERLNIMQDQDENEGVALCLGRFVSNVQWRDISDTLQHDAKRSLVNFFDGAIGITRHPDIDALAAVLDAFSGPREVTVIGRAEHSSLAIFD